MKFSIFLITTIYGARNDNRTTERRCSCRSGFQILNSLLFQLYIFVKADPFIGCRNNVKAKTISYFTIPALMLSLLSIFIMAVIDSYSGIIEGLVSNAGLSMALMALLKAGEPIHLGFCLHLFLHFFIINNNMNTTKTLIRKQISPSRCASRYSNNRPGSTLTVDRPVNSQFLSRTDLLRKQAGDITNRNSLTVPLLNPNERET